MSVPDLDNPWVSLFWFLHNSFIFAFGFTPDIQMLEWIFLSPLEMLFLNGRSRVEWLGAWALQPASLALPHPGCVAWALEAQTPFRVGCHSLPGHVKRDWGASNHRTFKWYLLLPHPCFGDLKRELLWGFGNSKVVPVRCAICKMSRAACVERLEHSFLGCGWFLSLSRAACGARALCSSASTAYLGRHGRARPVSDFAAIASWRVSLAPVNVLLVS